MIDSKEVRYEKIRAWEEEHLNPYLEGLSAEGEINDAMNLVNMKGEEADEIFRLTSLATFNERFVIPPAHREESIEMIEATADVKGETGFGFRERPERGL